MKQMSRTVADKRCRDMHRLNLCKLSGALWKEIARVQAELAKKRQLENTAVIFFRSLYISTRKEEAHKKQMEQREKNASLRFAEESPNLSISTFSGLPR